MTSVNHNPASAETVYDRETRDEPSKVSIMKKQSPGDSRGAMGHTYFIRWHPESHFDHWGFSRTRISGRIPAARQTGIMKGDDLAIPMCPEEPCLGA